MEQRKSVSRKKYRKRRRKRHAIRNLILLICFVIIIRCLMFLGDFLNGENSTDIGSMDESFSTTQSDAAETDEQEENSSQEVVPTLESEVPPSTPDIPWYLTLTNKWNPILENVEISLVEVVPGGAQVDERIYVPLTEMLEDAKVKNGDMIPTVNYGYRTQATQQELYDEKIAEYRKKGYSESKAVEEAGKWVAIPGTSEHQLGLAVDIKGNTYDVFAWLQENSYKYGFIFQVSGR